MTTTVGPGLLMPARDPGPQGRTGPCPTCKAAVVIDRGRIEIAHEVGAPCDHEGRA